MLNNIGLLGLIVLLLIPVLIIWGIVRASARKAAEQRRIADALEKLASEKAPVK